MTIKEFQHDGLSWDELAKKNELAAVIDPDGSKRKNNYIHSLHLAVVKKGFQKVKKGKVLDFGCGTGRVTRWLASRNFEVLGVDISAGMIAKARELTKKETGVSYIEFDGLNVPAESASFNAVVTVYVLQLSMRNTDLVSSIAMEFHRTLKPGGKLICIEITDSQSLSSKNYTDIITSAGFKLIHDAPVRLKTGRCMALAQRKYIPMIFIPLLAQVGILECQWKYQRNNVPDEYHDHLYIFEK